MKVDEFSGYLIPDTKTLGLCLQDFTAVKSTGNGDCFFNSLSLILSGNESMARELRRECAIEFKRNVESYLEHPHLEGAAKAIKVPVSIILQSILSPEALRTLNAPNSTLLQAMQVEASSTSTHRSWANILHVCVMATVLGQSIHSLYPAVPFMYRPLMHAVIQPLARNDNNPNPKYANLGDRSPIIILWTRDGSLDAEGVFEPNHVVPIMHVRNITLTKKRPAKSKPKHGKQVKLDGFFSPQAKSTSQSSGQASMTETSDQVPSQPSNQPPTDASSGQPSSNKSPTDTAPPDPPTGTPLSPSDQPPTDTPPSDQPPTDTPPSDQPPTDTPPSDQPPTDQPTTDQPLTDIPPTDKPSDQPPTDTPPLYQPPTDIPPLDQTPAAAGTLPSHQPSTDYPPKDTSTDQPPSSQPLTKTLNGPPSKPRHLTHAKRSFKSMWLNEFPWLVHEDGIFKCKNCLDTKKRNIFTLGKKGEPKKDDFVKHEKTVDHRHAVDIPKLKKDMKVASLKACETAKVSILAQMATVLMMAQEGIASSKNSSLVRLQIFNGADCLKPLRPQSGPHYQHADSVNDFYDALATVVRNRMVQERQDSPYPFYSVEMDEATDSANLSVLVMFYRYVSAEGTVTTKFLSAEHLNRTDAYEIHKTATETIAAKGFDAKDMVGLATDGASVMRGIHNGVATRFKKDNPKLIATHCMAHRLQLACEKAANKVPEVSKYIGVLNQLAKTIKFSPKFQRILSSSKEVHEENAHKIKQIFFTRWLTFKDSVQALAGSIGGVLSALATAAVDRDTEGRAMLHGIMSNIGTVKFVLLTHFLADVIGILGLVSLSAQNENVTYSYINSQLEAAKLALHVLLDMSGPYSKEIYGALPQEPDSCGYASYKGHDLKDSTKQREKFKRAAECLVEEVTAHLGYLFPDHSVLDATSVLSPCELHYLDEADVHNKLDVLLNHFSDRIDKQAALIEWDVLKFIMKDKKFTNIDTKEFMQKFLHPNRTVYPEISNLTACILCLPVTSVNCERGISSYNSIKTEFRSTLSGKNVNNLVVLFLEAPDFEDFDYEKAYEVWLPGKERRGLIAMMKECKSDSAM